MISASDVFHNQPPLFLQLFYFHAKKEKNRIMTQQSLGECVPEIDLQLQPPC